MDDRLKAIEEFMRSRGLKLTGPRRRVVEKLLSIKGHVAADDLIEQLRRDKTPVSKATVYRTLSLVTRSGLIDGHDFDGGKRLYEPMVGRAHHDHLYCIGCGKVIEFEEEAIERLQEYGAEHTTGANEAAELRPLDDRSGVGSPGQPLRPRT